ncbi:MAG: amidohydrolase [Oceanospirillaceae bacterium]|uniref:amidohydrolase family protein n=1 Tax=unclassified Thalassolituus TaxID=2624967 RepID=UPI000C58D855|nr:MULTISPECIES: amidohydrolase family protein [unclassified Thalassolituus]MBL34124.1 amidohydrolase [Oceanospirillaceae bacterium]MBS55196.1 amidohydrolase [Oceanospirillaceae bacterium]|tara:strand:+ start:7266 stop:8642 length:1377 start_codon:yes stop_codon:yes gene_type:complete
MHYLIQGAKAVFTESSVLDGGADVTDIRIRDGVITELGAGLIPAADETTIDAKGCVAYPGMVNTHHHLFQSVLKGIPEGLNHGLDDWLASVPFRFWPSITPELMYHTAKLGLYELLRSGATTCADHHYLYHAESTTEVEDAVWQAADELGIRLVLCRGSTTTKGSHRGMKASTIQPETLGQIIERMDESRVRYHQTGDMAMRKLVVAPTSFIHSSTENDLKACAQYARQHGLKLHSHLLEVEFDEIASQKNFGMRAIDYAEKCNWLGDDVWFAHLVWADDYAIKKLAETGTGIAHCPTSNCRLGSGIAPALDMQEAGMKITLGVDGSASAESGSMIQEANLAWLIHRAAKKNAAATTAEMAINWASKNGAELLGLNGTGEIKVGKAADIVLYNTDKPRFAGVHSTLEAPLLCAEPVEIKYSFVHGKPVVENGCVKGLDEAELVANVQQGVADLIKKVS